MSKEEKITGIMGRASILILIVPFLYMCGVVLSHGIPDLPNSGDGALLELSTRNLFSSGILLGPYSRFFFFHPGPLYFFLRFPLYILSGCSNSSFLITSCLIAMGSLFGAWHFVRKRLGDKAALLFSICLALFILQSDKAVLFSEWNPFVIMLPAMLFCVSTAAFAARVRNAFWVMVLSGSFVAQTHLGGIPVLGSVFITGLICMIYQWTLVSKGKSSSPVVWKPLLLGTALLLVLWLPPLYQQFTAPDKGNMTEIQEFFETTHAEISPEEAFNAWINTVSRFELGAFAVSPGESDPSGIASLVVVAIQLLLLSAAYSMLRKQGDQPFLSALNLICIVIHGATWYSISQIRGDLNDYLIEWMSIITPLSVFVILYSFLRLNREKLKRLWIKPVYISSGLFVLLTVLALMTARDCRGYFRTEPDRSWVNDISTVELSEQLSTVLEKCGRDFYILNLQSQENWPVFFGLMNRLEKQGYPIGVEDNFMYPYSQIPVGMNPRPLYIGTLIHGQSEFPGLVASFNGIGLILQ